MSVAVLVTRGTTYPNRLRRLDSWIRAELAGSLNRTPDPLIVDLGFGSSPTTTIEMLGRLRSIRPDVRVLGLETDAARVAVAQAAELDGLRFAVGDFGLAGSTPALVRMANVLRQYPESAVLPAWRTVQSRLAPGGHLIDATTDELGRLGSWALVSPDGPLSLTLSARLAHLDRPCDLAPRLIKALIHRNVAGEPIHQLLRDMDEAWDRNAALAAFGPRQRWQAMCCQVARNWPVLSDAGQHRSGYLTIAWAAVAPADSRP